MQGLEPSPIHEKLPSPYQAMPRACQREEPIRMHSPGRGGTGQGFQRQMSRLDRQSPLPSKGCPRVREDRIPDILVGQGCPGMCGGKTGSQILTLVSQGCPGVWGGQAPRHSCQAGLPWGVAGGQAPRHSLLSARVALGYGGGISSQTLTLVSQGCPGVGGWDRLPDTHPCQPATGRC